MSDKLEGLKPCPFCGAELFVRQSVNSYGRCETEGCWMCERKIGVPLDGAIQVAAWNTRPTVEADRGEVEREECAKLVESYDPPQCWDIRRPTPMQKLAAAIRARGTGGEE